MVVVHWPKGFESHEFCDFVEVGRSVILRPQTVGWNRARAVNVGAPKADGRRIHANIHAPGMRIVGKRMMAVAVEMSGSMVGSHPDAMSVMGQPNRLSVHFDHLDGMEPSERIANLPGG